MANILYLVHRLPYPPNKGDKVRSYHLLKHLAARHDVHLGTFVDDPDDWVHLPRLEALCASVHAAPLNPRRGRLASLRGLATGEALSLPYYRHKGLANWVRTTAARERLDAVVVFSSTMAQYAAPLSLPTLVDFVDVDSAKWTDYAKQRPWPLSWLYAREGRLLLKAEAAIAERARCSYFVTDKEVALFKQLAPTVQAPIEALCNGVDAEFFSPSTTRESPFDADEIPLVFTGAMDYWPNVDAACWFAAEVLPSLRKQHPKLRFHIVGRSPTPAVQALAGDAIRVSGTVPDVRPYLEHAAVVVAPLRLARGIQNKVLEAMAMARPVVAAGACVEAITHASPGEHLLAADAAQQWIEQLDGLLCDTRRARTLAEAARACVLQHYGWDAHLAGLDHYLQGLESA